MAGEIYNEDYFLHGRESKKSLYDNYRWMPELTVPMAERIVHHCGIKKDDHMVLDFGCARGYVVKALRMLGYYAWGYDISQWALDNADPEVKIYMICNDSALFANSFDWVLAKDVLEHVKDLPATINQIMDMAKMGVFAVVPLASDSVRYDVPEYEEDVTHIHRRPLDWWVARFHRPGWSVEARYRMRGVKDNYSKYKTGNGFITARRI